VGSVNISNFIQAIWTHGREFLVNHNQTLLKCTSTPSASSCTSAPSTSTSHQHPHNTTHTHSARALSWPTSTSTQHTTHAFSPSSFLAYTNIHTTHHTRIQPELFLGRHQHPHNTPHTHSARALPWPTSTSTQHITHAFSPSSFLADLGVFVQKGEGQGPCRPELVMAYVQHVARAACV